MLLNTISNLPLPFTSSENFPSSSVRNMATGFSVLPALNTRTVAKGSLSPKVSSINTPFTVVWAMTVDDIVIITTAAIIVLNCFISLLFCYLLRVELKIWCKGMKNPIPFKISFDEMGDVFRRNSRLKSVSLFITSSSALILRACHVEVIVQGEAHLLGIVIDVGGCLADVIISRCL